MTSAQQKFVELEKQKEEVKKFYEDLKGALEDVIKEIGVDAYFQDQDGVVYKTIVPEGKWVQFETHSYIRTRREHEKRGDLSLKEAEEAGFTVTRK